MKKETKNFLLTLSFFAIVQPIVYTSIKYLQNNYHLIGLPLDNQIPFLPYFIYIYNLFYPFIIISYYYIYKKDSKNYYVGIITGIISCLLAYFIFLVYPTIIIRPDITNLSLDPITRFILNITYTVDTPAINCFPSIHCIFCFAIIFITSISSKINTKSKILINTLSSLIIISTLLVKQHYVLDVISAFIITSIIILIVKIKSK